MAFSRSLIISLNRDFAGLVLLRLSATSLWESPATSLLHNTLIANFALLNQCDVPDGGRWNINELVPNITAANNV